MSSITPGGISPSAPEPISLDTNCLSCNSLSRVAALFQRGNIAPKNSLDERHALLYRGLVEQSILSTLLELREARNIAHHYTASVEGALSSSLASLHARVLESKGGDAPDIRALLGERGALAREWAAKVATITGTASDEVLERSRRHFRAVLNTSEWTPLKESVETIVNGAPCRLHLESIPLNRAFSERFPLIPEFQNYGSGGKTAGALKVQSDCRDGRLANGWFLQMRAESGAPLFEAFRSAVVCPYGVEDREERLFLTRHMAVEGFKAIAARRFALLSEEGKQLVLNQKKVWGFTIVSIDLQTKYPDNARDGEQPLEARALRESQMMFDILNDKEITLPVSNHGTLDTLTIKPHIFTLNYPVDEKGFHSGVGFAESDMRHNAKVLYELQLQARERILQRSSVARELKMRTFLDGELRTFLADSAYADAAYDPYKMNSRIALLSHLLGHSVWINCRSGKDRTGQAIAETALLAHRLSEWAERSTDIGPQYSRRLNEFESKLLYDLSLGLGNAEVQRLNTGVPGSKVRPIFNESAEDPLVDRIGFARWKRFKGFSSVAYS